MADFGGIPVREFSIVDVLSYFIPGAVMLFAVHTGQFFREVYPVVFSIDNVGLRIFLLLVGSYLVGHALHFPAVKLGNVIKRLIGRPVVFLARMEEKRLSWFKRRLRNDFPVPYKKALINALMDYWALDSENCKTVDESNYYALCELLVEHSCPNAWIIHERFYSTGSLLRAMVLPTVLLGIVLLKSSFLVAILLFFSTICFCFRYYSLEVAGTKQIYNGFYLFYLSSKKSRSPE